MRISTKMKKVSTLGLASIVGTNTFAAGWLSDRIDNGLLNVTPGGTMVETDGSGHIKNQAFYTTSVYFRFGSAATPPEPFWSFSPPEVSAGCNGINIKGMFFKLTGLDRLESTLKNAGASLAWGIVVGLIYSLPGVASSFKMLNDWAKKIQQLIANACQSGMAIGQAIYNNTSIKNNAEKLAAVPDDVFNSIIDKDTQKGINDFFSGEDSIFDDNMVFKAESSASEPSEADAMKFYSEQLQPAFLSTTPTASVLQEVFHRMSNAGGTNLENFVTSVLGDSIQNSVAEKGMVEKDFYLTLSGDSVGTIGTTQIFSVNSIISSYASGASEEDKIYLKSTLASLILYNNIGKPMVLTSNGVSHLVELIGDRTDSLDGSTTQTDEEKLELNKQKESGLDYNPAAGTKYPFFLGETFMSYFLQGGNSMNKEYIQNQFNENFHAMKVKLIVTKTKTNENGKYYIYLFPLGTDPQLHAIEVDPNIKGAVERSKDLFTSIVNTGDYAQSVTDAGIDCFVPDLFDKLAIIQKTPGGTGSSSGLGALTALADYNAGKAAEVLASSLINIAGIRPSNNLGLIDINNHTYDKVYDITSPSTQKQISEKAALGTSVQSSLKNINEFVEGMKNIAEKSNIANNDLNKLNALFKDIKQKNTARAVNKVN